jgi:hypothetical protein
MNQGRAISSIQKEEDKKVRTIGLTEKAKPTKNTIEERLSNAGMRILMILEIFLGSALDLDFFLLVNTTGCMYITF